MLFNVIIHNSIVIYQPLLANKKIDPLTFRIHLIKELIRNHVSLVPHPVHGLPFVEPPLSRGDSCHWK
jgi:hypothetical protein